MTAKWSGVNESVKGYWARRFALVALSSMMGLCAPGSGSAQPPKAKPEFEVASLKLSPRCLDNVALSRSTPGRLVLPCISLRNLVWTAYGRFDGLMYSAKPYLRVVGGPDWAASEHYQIFAKADNGAHIAEMAGPMLQSLLEDRFHLRVHKEPRDTPVYALTLAGDKARLHPLPESACARFDLDALVAARGENEPGDPKQCPSFQIAGAPQGEPMVADCHGMTMAEFASLALGSFVDRPVIDRTGLIGRFEIHLEAVKSAPPPDVAWMMANGITPPSSPPDPDLVRGPTVFQALQKQLGLKLVPARAPVDVLVIDHAERPTED